MKELINKVNQMDALDLLKQIPDKSIDLVLTDPPYGIDYERHIKNKKHSKINNDNNLDWLEDSSSEIKRIVKEDYAIYWFCSWHNIDKILKELKKSFHVKNVIVWNKGGGGMGDLETCYGGVYELCIYMANKSKKLSGSRDNDVINRKRTGNKFHPTEKPISLMEYFIQKSSEESQLILDPFMGSWTTAVACQNLKRNFIGCELDKDYCEIGKQRLRQKTLF